MFSERPNQLGHPDQVTRGLDPRNDDRSSTERSRTIRQLGQADITMVEQDGCPTPAIEASAVLPRRCVLPPAGSIDPTSRETFNYLQLNRLGATVRRLPAIPLPFFSDLTFLVDGYP